MAPMRTKSIPMIVLTSKYMENVFAKKENVATTCEAVKKLYNGTKLYNNRILACYIQYEIDAKGPLADVNRDSNALLKTLRSNKQNIRSADVYTTIKRIEATGNILRSCVDGSKETYRAATQKFYETIENLKPQ